MQNLTFQFHLGDTAGESKFNQTPFIFPPPSPSLCLNKMKLRVQVFFTVVMVGSATAFFILFGAQGVQLVNEASSVVTHPTPSPPLPSPPIPPSPFPSNSSSSWFNIQGFARRISAAIKSTSTTSSILSMVASPSTTTSMQLLPFSPNVVLEPESFVHITVRNKTWLPPSQYRVAAAWQALNPTFQIILYDDDDVNRLFVTDYPEFRGLFDSLLDPVERVDIWRYLIVHSKGGVYADSDWMPVRPIHEWLPIIRANVSKPTHDFINNSAAIINATTNNNDNCSFISSTRTRRIPNVNSSSPFSSSISNSNVSLILGFEGASSHFGSLQIIQWGFYALTTHHPLLYDTVRHIQDFYVDELLSMTWRGDAVQRTGPEPFTWATLRYLQQCGANISSMSTHQSFIHANVAVAGYEFFEQSGSLARHEFLGSWKRCDSWWACNVQKRRLWQEESRKRFDEFVHRFWEGQVSV